MQYLFSPVIIIIIGFYFNVQLERTKQSFQTLELELKRIQAAQQMLEELFSGTPERAFIAERLIGQIVDENLREEIHKLVADYYTEQFDESIYAQDISKLSKISKAARKVKSAAGDKVVSAFMTVKYHIVAASKPSEETALEYADELKQTGFSAEAYFVPTTGIYAVTLGAYPLEEAMAKRNQAIQESIVTPDAWLSKGEGWKKITPAD
ncbi:MAG: SPOR domain-containing protein, partial [Candidatus Zixiibacteriota bacterium]